MQVQNTWKQITIPFSAVVNNVLQQQYLAAQFIALVGRYLISKKPDGSNINMQFLPEKELLLGNQHPDGWTVGVKLKDLTVQILGKNLNVTDEVSLEGKTFSDAFQEFKVKLNNNGIDISGLITKQPYELPTSSLKDGLYFSTGPENSVAENIRYRHNAQLIIDELASEFKEVEPVRIWPHHFDTGTFATLARNKKVEATKTIGLGWAIPDGMVSEPYFYLSFWSEIPIELEANSGSLPAGKWMMPNWNGAVLGVSEILEQSAPESQYKLVRSFFESGLNILKES